MEQIKKASENPILTNSRNDGTSDTPDKKDIPITKKSKIAEIGQVSMILDDYDDIFSDFDPRPYSQRALSDDFLSEAKKVVKEEPTGKIKLKFLIPEKRRDVKSEEIIKKRLKSHFRKQYKASLQKNKNTIIRSVILIVVGFVMMILATYIYHIEPDHFSLYALIVILEPSGWFSVWYGLEQIFYSIGERNEEIEFNKKMSKADIVFYFYK